MIVSFEYDGVRTSEFHVCLNCVCLWACSFDSYLVQHICQRALCLFKFYCFMFLMTTTLLYIMRFFWWQVMTKNLEQVVSMVLNSFQDPHPRARWAAINAIGQLSTDLGPDLQVQYHHLVLPALVAAMDDYQNPRVQVSFL